MCGERGGGLPARLEDHDAGAGRENRGGSLLAPTLALAGFVVAILGSLALGPARGWASQLRYHFRDGAEVLQLEDFDGGGGNLAATTGPGGEGTATFTLFGYPGIAMVLFLMAAACGFYLVFTTFVRDARNRSM